MNHDITYCLNWQCPFTDCERHSVNAPRGVTVSCAYLDGTCRRYIEYVLEQVLGKIPPLRDRYLRFIDHALKEVQGE